MSYCKLEIQKIKVEDGNDGDANNHKNHEPAVVCHNFWNKAPEELLMEIFIRHPDCRSAVRTSTVCCQWHSLILRNPQFIQRFKSHHQDTILPWTIVFREAISYDIFRTLGQLYSDEWMCLHGKLPANCLDFLPSPMLIKAWCNDLLLVSPGDDLYICNPVTKQLVQLPAAPRPLEVDTQIYEVVEKGYALAAMPASGANTNSQFKVVEVLPLYDYRNFRRLKVSIFCSESKKWERRDFPAPLPKIWWKYGWFLNITIIRCNEILFWVGTSLESEAIVYLDLSKEKCGVINIPSGDRPIVYRFGILHVIGGLDELRLIQVLRMKTAKIVHLRVWRLNNNLNNDHEEDDSNWILVHDKKLKRPKNLSKKQALAGTFVHPTNGDLLFVVWGKTIIEYNLINETYKKIAELLGTTGWFNLTPFFLDLSSGSSNLANTYF